MINQDLVNKIHCLLDKGIIYGLSEDPKPGEMCVEQVISYVLGEEVTDRPSCVGKEIRDFVTSLNEQEWSSASARAEGMRKLAIAQLGSNSLDQKDFFDKLSFAVITKMLPAMFRDLGEERWEKQIAVITKLLLTIFRALGEERWEKQIKSLKGAKNLEGAIKASHDAAKALYNYIDAYDSPTGIAASHADNAARHAAHPAYYFGDAAYFIVSAACHAADATKTGDKYLKMVSHLAVEVLKDMKSPGCQFI